MRDGGRRGRDGCNRLSSLPPFLLGIVMMSSED